MSDFLLPTFESNDFDKWIGKKSHTELINGIVHGYIENELVFMTPVEAWEDMTGREYIIENEEDYD